MQVRDRVVGVARADDASRPVTSMRGWPASARAAAMRLRSGVQSARVLERIAGRHQPPDPVEAEPLHRQQAGGAMRLMRRIERAAEQADAHAGRVRRQRRAAGGSGAALARGRAGAPITAGSARSRARGT